MLRLGAGDGPLRRATVFGSLRAPISADGNRGGYRRLEGSAIDPRMSHPKGAVAPLAKLTMTELMKRRAEIETGIETAETVWLEASGALEEIAE